MAPQRVGHTKPWARFRALGALLLACLSVTAPLSAQSPAKDSAASHALSRGFSAAYMRGDVDAMVRLYAADAVISPSAPR